ncbi:hypothetical protein C4D60_Mb01t26690 [Musa balbisiana]|uniref:Uncharacterized protein n=1 Tax=Musa balbisiana TaxID=52838 RepID=A0A4S8JQZ1_MUSBA|nr:hypothetical protein C4D60_Mb01t26690 [Musa balbisiana]
MVKSMKRQVVEASHKLDCHVNGPCSGEFHEGTKALGSVWEGITDRKSRSTGSFRGLKDICIFFSNIPLESLQVSSSSISHKSGFLMLYKLSLLGNQSEHPASSITFFEDWSMETVVHEAKYECLLFDMDDTLYPLSSGLNLACRKNIEDYMLHHLQIEESQVPKMCLELYKEYGTTMAGLKALGYEFDDDEFHAYVHGRLPYEILKPDPLLRNLLLSMPQRKIILTNADRAHAARVLSRLGLEDCFEGVICFETLNPPPQQNGSADGHGNFGETDSNTDGESDSSADTASCVGGRKSNSKGRILCKPSQEAIEAAIKIANIDPKRTVGSPVLVPGADVALESIHNMREALPEIWKEGDKLEPVLAATAVETTVLA